MEIKQPFQNLSTPMFDSAQVNALVFLPVLPKGARSEHLSDEIHVAVRSIDPGSVEFHDVGVF